MKYNSQYYRQATVIINNEYKNWIVREKTNYFGMFSTVLIFDTIVFKTKEKCHELYPQFWGKNWNVVSNLLHLQNCHLFLSLNIFLVEINIIWEIQISDANSAESGAIDWYHSITHLLFPTIIAGIIWQRILLMGSSVLTTSCSFDVFIRYLLSKYKSDAIPNQ